jgi:hypothetical protein
MPEDETGRIPVDTFDLYDDPDAWEDVCDDPVIWPEDEGEK